MQKEHSPKEFQQQLTGTAALQTESMPDKAIESCQLPLAMRQHDLLASTTWLCILWTDDLTLMSAVSVERGTDQSSVHTLKRRVSTRTDCFDEHSCRAQPTFQCACQKPADLKCATAFMRMSLLVQKEPADLKCAPAFMRTSQQELYSSRETHFGQQIEYLTTQWRKMMVTVEWRFDPEFV